MTPALAPLRRLRVAANRWMVPRDASYAVLLFAAFLLFFHLGRRELYSSHEARAAQNAQRMLDTGEWGLPVLFDGQLDLQKPPGYYWLVAIAGRCNGGAVTAFEARLPAALAGFLTVAMVLAFLRSEGRPRAGNIAAIVLATAIHFTAISRTARIDVPLACAITASLLTFYKAHTGGPVYAWCFASAVAAAGGVMLKGPIALALIGPLAVIWPLTSARTWWHRHAYLCSSSNAQAGMPVLSEKKLLGGYCLGFATVFALAAPWFLWANRATGGEFLRVFFWHHNVERFTGGSPTLATHAWWYYFPRFAADFLPWTPVLLWAGVGALRSADGASRLNKPSRLIRFALLWFAAMFLVLSASQFKRADYLLPLYPAAAIVLGCAAERWRRANWLVAGIAAASLIGWQLVANLVEPAEQAREEKQAFAREIRRLAPSPQEVMLFRTESHLLAFHLGRPIITRVEWHDLNDWLAAPGPHLVVMPPEYAYPAQQIVRSRKLAVAARLEEFTTGKPHRPLVLLRAD